MMKMNPITFPIIVTIIVIGAIAIILVKLLYKDRKTSDLSDDLPPIVDKHWRDPFKEDMPEEKEESENYSFVSKSWEEPMKQKKELKNGVASKVFQEPMHVKHQDIINEYNNENYDNLDNSFEKDNLYNLNSSENLENEFSDIDRFDDNVNLEEKDDGSFSITSNESIPVESKPMNNRYIVPEENYPPTNDLKNSYEEIDNNENNVSYKSLDDYQKAKYPIKENTDNYNNEHNNKYSDEHANNYSKSYESDKNYSDSNQNEEKSSKSGIDNPYGYKDDDLDNEGLFNMSEQIFIGGNYYNIKVGDEIIFNYNGESYSSKILEIKHENIRVKYRAQEKWISFSDVKKVF